MTLDTVLRTIAAGLGILLSPVVLGFVWRGAGIVKDIQRDVKDVNKQLLDLMERVVKGFEDHELRLRDQEGKMAVVWDGRERRRS